MTLIDYGFADAERAQGTYYQLCVAVAVEGGCRDRDRVVDVAQVMEDGAASATASEELDRGASEQNGVVGFEPWVLVAAENQGGSVGVEEEGVGFGGEGGEEVVLE